MAYIDHLHQHRVSVGEGAEWRDQTHRLYFRFDPSRRQRTAICERDNVLLIAMSPMRCRRCTGLCVPTVWREFAFILTGWRVHQLRLARRTSMTHPLSPRERQIIKLLCEEGATNREAAAVLHISRKTVEVHRGNLMRKLGVTVIGAMMRTAMEQGYVKIRVRSRPPLRHASRGASHDPL